MQGTNETKTGLQIQRTNVIARGEAVWETGWKMWRDKEAQISSYKQSQDVEHSTGNAVDIIVMAVCRDRQVLEESGDHVISYINVWPLYCILETNTKQKKMQVPCSKTVKNFKMMTAEC